MMAMTGVRLLAGASLHVITSGNQFGLNGMMRNYIRNRTSSFLEVQTVKIE
jgi:hypothetical protein